MYVIDFKAASVIVGRTLQLIPQLRVAEPYWISLCAQMEKCRVGNSKDERAALDVLDTLAKTLVQQSNCQLKALADTSLYGVVFALIGRGYVRVEKALGSPGLYRIGIHFMDDLSSEIMGSLVRSKISFTADFYT